MNKIKAIPIVLIASILLLMGVLSKLDAQPSVNFENRKNTFYAEMLHLQTAPNKLKLVLWLRPYRLFSQKDLAKYLQDIHTDFIQKETNFNSSQRIYLLYEIGLIQTASDSLDAAHKTLNKALKLSNLNDDFWTNFRLQDAIAFVHRQKNEYQKAYNTLEQLLKLSITNNNKDGEISCKYWMAEHLENMGRHEETLSLASELYQYSIENNDSINACYDLIQMGTTSAFLETDTSYFEYFHRAIALAIKIPIHWTHITGVAYYETGFAYLNINAANTALSYFKKAFQHIDYLAPREKIRFYEGYSMALLETNNLNEAKKQARIGLHKAQKLKGDFWTAGSLYNLARYYQSAAKYDSALIFLNQALFLHKQFSNKKTLPDIYKTLSEVNTKLHRYTQAIAFLDTAHSIENEIISNTNANILAKYRTESDYYLQKERITELNNQNSINSIRAKQLKFSLFGISFILLVILLFTVINRYQLKHLKESHLNLVRKNLELDELNKKLSYCKSTNGERKRTKDIKNEDILLEQIHKLLHKNEIFKDSNLSLHSLAEDLNTNTSYLSNIINSHYNCNLKSLINKLRIDKAKEIMTSKEIKQLSMGGIADKVGFKSRSGFYKSFKTFTGLTPTQYISNYNLIEKNTDS